MIDIIIIGGGVLGLSTSILLSKEGYAVTIVDREKCGCGASSINAGLIVPSMYNPLPLSINMKNIIKWLFTKHSPVKINLLSIDFKWLWELTKSKDRLLRDDRWRLLRKYGDTAIELIEELIEEGGIKCKYRKGVLEIYSQQKHFDDAVKYAFEIKKDGREVEVLDKTEISSYERNINNYIGGLYYPDDASLDPEKYMEGLEKYARERGIKILRGINIKKIGIDKHHIRLYGDKELQSKKLVIASGAWISQLSESVGIKIPIIPAKGYVIKLKRNSEKEKNIRYPVMIEEEKIVVNQLDTYIHIAGILDITGFNPRIPHNRIFRIIENTSKYIPSLKNYTLIKTLYGYRPCTPDEIPIICRAPKTDNIFIIGGHCRFGLTYSALSAKILCSIIIEEKPIISPEIFHINRFKL
jgi:D-amino-acid dehydrogenase